MMIMNWMNIVSAMNVLSFMKKLFTKSLQNPFKTKNYVFTLNLTMGNGWMGGWNCNFSILSVFLYFYSSVEAFSTSRKKLIAMNCCISLEMRGLCLQPLYKT